MSNDDRSPTVRFEVRSDDETVRVLVVDDDGNEREAVHAAVSPGTYLVIKQD